MLEGVTRVQLTKESIDIFFGEIEELYREAFDCALDKDEVVDYGGTTWGTGYVYVDEDSKVVGYINFEKADEPENRKCRLHEIAIWEKHQRQGLGSLMVKDMIEDLKEETEILVTPLGDEESKWYKKFGFEDVDGLRKRVESNGLLIRFKNANDSN